jgi:hypothetical protein
LSQEELQEHEYEESEDFHEDDDLDLNSEQNEDDFSEHANKHRRANAGSLLESENMDDEGTPEIA